jgi:outer membrane immunogenic protein
MRLSIWAVGISAIVASSAAFAADLDGGRAAPSAVNWAGFYAGANVGYIGGRTSATDQGPIPEYVLGHKFSFLANDASVGLQTGYNIQFGAVVFGPEVDVGTFGVRGSAPYFPTQPDTYIIGRANYDVTTRARVGYAFDRALLYATGGVIFTDEHDQLFSFSNVQSPNAAAKAGWVIGGGVEYALTPQWSIKGEYLHYDLGDMTVTTSNAVNYKVSNAGDMARIGLNFHFDAR